MKLGKTIQVDRSQAVKHLAVGQALHETARDLSELAEPRYGNGMAIISIHAAIAYTDALTIAFRGIKSADGDHARAADLLKHALGSRAVETHVRRLRAILNAKSNVSYSGAYYTLEEARSIYQKTGDFIGWAAEMYAERPG